MDTLLKKCKSDTNATSKKLAQLEMLVELLMFHLAKLKTGYWRREILGVFIYADRGAL